jgi:hypothetical protein
MTRSGVTPFALKKAMDLERKALAVSFFSSGSTSVSASLAASPMAT